eukprot:TRINITY_DN13557_c0_g1_i2.p4 TRINITY_DN13557_c0_g1~~TRINITY_DN13557_c0_g1_i2.p4  ORF type:complete len:103 (-),score=19.80 TRINITY_DN13557_c0_g1_i2:447-755(-)
MHNSTQFTLLREANSIQQQHVKLISETADAVEKQGVILDDLDQAVLDVKNRVTDLGGYSIWAPAPCLKNCCILAMAMVLFWMGLGFLLYYTVDHITERDDNG